MTDDKYKEMEKAERRFKRTLKKNNYRVLKIKCCLTCKKQSSMSPDDPMECSEAAQEGWMFSGIEELGICDLYEERD